MRYSSILTAGAALAAACVVTVAAAVPSSAGDASTNGFEIRETLPVLVPVAAYVDKQCFGTSPTDPNMKCSEPVDLAAGMHTLAVDLVSKGGKATATVAPLSETERATCKPQAGLSVSQASFGYVLSGHSNGYDHRVTLDGTPVLGPLVNSGGGLFWAAGKVCLYTV